MGCRKLKVGDTDWIDAAMYLERSYEVQLSHGYCPDCSIAASATVDAWCAQQPLRTALVAGPD